MTATDLLWSGVFILYCGWACPSVRHWLARRREEREITAAISAQQAARKRRGIR